MSARDEELKENALGIVFAGIAGLFTLFLIIAFFFGLAASMKHYSVWAMEKTGEGMLRQANYERQTQVAQAQAERDSAALRAEAIHILGAAAQQYPEYRQQEFIGAFARCLETGCASQIIYVPTEANIPITEAGKR